ncbi:hypothetical protein [Streptomyces sp. GESEQ-35]|uniref:hypothetical protein n=1 Tax=Streptomyces sp. GESEQ-35 TaxID=2812657 RepID=UPI001B31F24D|nr:hypothetical protein [Streptomyces sp. GESEQ-35]
MSTFEVNTSKAKQALDGGFDSAKSTAENLGARFRGDLEDVEGWMGDDKYGQKVKPQYDETNRSLESIRTLILEQLATTGVNLTETIENIEKTNNDAKDLIGDAERNSPFQDESGGGKR